MRLNTINQVEEFIWEHPNISVEGLKVFIATSCPFTLEELLLEIIKEMQRQERIRNNVL